MDGVTRRETLSLHATGCKFHPSSKYQRAGVSPALFVSGFELPAKADISCKQFPDYRFHFPLRISVQRTSKASCLH